MLEGGLLVGLGLVFAKFIFIHPHAWGLGKSCGTPCEISRAGSGWGLRWATLLHYDSLIFLGSPLLEPLNLFRLVML